MKVNEINSYRKDSNLLKWILAVMLFLSIGGNVFMYQQNIEFLKSIGNKRIVVDKENNTWVATYRELSTEERKAQYAKHVVLWSDLMWQHKDAVSMDQHLDAALDLGGESIEKAYNYYYVEKGIERLVKENNWRTEVKLMSPPEVNMTTTPVEGVAKFHWTLFDSKGGEIWTRNMNFKFTLRDVAVTYGNPLGAFLEINVFDDSKVGSDDKGF